ncbi:hypothetical protein BHE74_00052083 [Ensete ventricosum]|nr:hypothetical protein BHE74_00052083 [Ensete ventricosum]RZS05604.1 hypothetical protein BHM03_00036137 [Ensete ventricosum]
MWILLERRTLDFLHLLHLDLKYRDIRSPLQGGGAATHGQPPCRAGHPRPRPPTRWQSAAVRPQGRQPPAGTTTYSAVPVKGGRLQDTRKGLSPVASPTASRPLARRMPAGKGSRHLCRDSSGDGDA